MHIRDVSSRALPMERVRVNPFGMYEKVPGIGRDGEEGMRRKFGMPDGVEWLADELESVLPRDELDYIRNGGLGEYEEVSGTGFETRMKYFQF